MKLTHSLVAGAVVATLGLGTAGAGVVSAASNTSTSGQDTLVQKIADRFHLNKSDVQAVFDQNRKDHMAEMQASQKERLAQAVKDGKLTQEQADHITQAQAEIQALIGDTKPRDLPDSTRAQIKAKRDALRDWAKANNIDMKYIAPGGHGRGMGMMHGDVDGDSDDASTSPSSTIN